jgi:DNA gyrase subunit A
MTASGVVIRTPVNEIRVIGRGTKGVKIMRLDENDRVIGIAVVPTEIENGPTETKGEQKEGEDEPYPPETTPPA